MHKKVETIITTSTVLECMITFIIPDRSLTSWSLNSSNDWLVPCRTKWGIYFSPRPAINECPKSVNSPPVPPTTPLPTPRPTGAPSDEEECMLEVGGVLEK